MSKIFSLKQLFAIVDGRLSTTMSDIYEMLNHICDTELMTHHLPIAKQYLHEKEPEWFKDVKARLESLYEACPIKEKNKDQFLWCMENIENKSFNIPQLKQEFDTSDFKNYMINNSILR